MQVFFLIFLRTSHNFCAMAKKWARITINIEQDLAEAIRLRAAKQRRSASGYLAWLVESDLERHGVLHEAPAPYGGEKEGVPTNSPPVPIGGSNPGFSGMIDPQHQAS